MTEEKKKAVELVERYESQNNVEITYQRSAHSAIERYPLNREEAKQCALICVDGILEEYDLIAPSYPRKEFWQSVKEEIELI